MKKLIIIITLVIISMTSNAQNFKTFVINNGGDFTYYGNTKAVMVYNKANGTSFHTMWEIYTASKTTVVTSPEIDSQEDTETISISNIESIDSIAIQPVNIKADSVNAISYLQEGDTLVHKGNFFLNKRTNQPISYLQAPDSLVNTTMTMMEEVHIYKQVIKTTESKGIKPETKHKGAKVKYQKRKSVLKHYSCGNRRSLINKIGVGVIKFTPLGWGLGIMPWTDLSKKFNQ